VDRFRTSIVIAAVTLISCAQMQRDWQAQQQAQAQAQADAQPANMEQLCKSAVNAYCARCTIDQAACGKVYVACLGTASPADPSAYTMGQVNQCVADVNAGDCNVMPTVWPATCTAPTQPAAQSCSGGATWDGTQCVCAAGTAWDGAQCAAQAGDAPVCNGGSTWDGAQCVCPAGTTWDGAQCAGAAAPPPPPAGGKQCRAKLLQKGYAPDQLPNCEGVSDRCALAVLNRGYAPDQLANCRGVDGACAEGVIAKGYAPDQLVNCRK
jgi:hypothetical protein